MHVRAIGIEDSRHFDTHTVLPVIIEEQGFRTTLSFVVARALTDRIDVPPIVLALRMLLRIAIHLAGRGLKNLRPDALGQPEHVDRAMHAGFRRLYRIVLVMDWRSRTGEVVDFVHLDVKGKGDIVPHELEPRVVQQRNDVRLGPGKQVVGTNHFVPARKQFAAQVRAKKTRPAGDKNPLALRCFHALFLSLALPAIALHPQRLQTIRQKRRRPPAGMRRLDAARRGKSVRRAAAVGRSFYFAGQRMCRMK